LALSLPLTYWPKQIKWPDSESTQKVINTGCFWTQGYIEVRIISTTSSQIAWQVGRETYYMWRMF
jgi:hypothetical protein